MAERKKGIPALPLMLLRSQRGATIYLVMGLLIAVGGVIYHLMDVGKNLQNASRSQRLIAEKEDLRRTMDILLSNRDLCLEYLRVHDDNFYFHELLVPGQNYLRSLTIKEMKIEDREQLNPMLYSGRFVIRLETGTGPDGPSTREISRVVNYKPTASDRVTECVGHVDPKLACARIGLQWNEEEDQCDICKALGHKWSNGRCV